MRCHDIPCLHGILGTSLGVDTIRGSLNRDILRLTSVERKPLNQEDRFCRFRQFAKMETRVAFFVVTLSLMVAVALGVKPNQPTLSVVPDPATVDAGITVKFTCTKADTGSTPTSWEWYIGTDKQSQTTATFDYVALTAATTKSVTCKGTDGTTPSDPSTGKTLTISDVPVPTLTSDPVKSGDKVTVKNGFTAKFTCAKKDTAKQDPVKYKFFEGTNEITTGTPAGASITGGVLTVTASSTWEGKVIKCQHYNTATAKTDSATTFTLAVTMVPNKPKITFDSPLKENAELKVTCAKEGTVVVNSFEIYQDSKKMDTGITSSTGTLKDIYTVAKVTKADHNGKKYKCLATNTDGNSQYSDEKTLEVTDSGAGSQLVSMTTMALVLVLGAFFKE